MEKTENNGIVVCQNCGASTPEQPLAEYRNKVIEDCSITIENCEPDEHGRLSIQEIAEAVSAMKEQP